MINRIKKDVKSNADLTKPLKIPLSNEDDCFGLEYDFTTTECSLCADQLVCGIAFKKNLSKTTKKLDAEHQFLDTANFANIDKNKLFKKIIGFEYSEVIEYIKQSANVKYQLAEKWLDFHLDFYKLVVKDGIICTI